MRHTWTLNCGRTSCWQFLNFLSYPDFYNKPCHMVVFMYCMHLSSAADLTVNTLNITLFNLLLFFESTDWSVLEDRQISVLHRWSFLFQWLFGDWMRFDTTEGSSLSPRRKHSCERHHLINGIAMKSSPMLKRKIKINVLKNLLKFGEILRLCPRNPAPPTPTRKRHGTATHPDLSGLG